MFLMKQLTTLARGFRVCNVSPRCSFQRMNCLGNFGAFKLLSCGVQQRAEDTQITGTQKEKIVIDSVPKLRIGIIPPERTEEVLDFLYNYQLRDTFLWKSVDACPLGYRIPIYDASMRKIIKHGVSVMAEEETTGKLITVMINRIVTRNYNPMFEIDEETERMDIPERLQMVIGILQDVNKKYDSFEKHKVDQIIFLQHLCMHRDYRGKGLSKMMDTVTWKLIQRPEIKVYEGIRNRYIYDDPSMPRWTVMAETKYDEFIFNGQLVFKSVGLYTGVMKIVCVI